jgi:hypothetical protein
MIEEGIPKDSLQKAVDLLLRISSDYHPNNYKPKIIHEDNTAELHWLFYSLIIFIIALFRPKNTIGIGKSKTILQAYKIWRWVVLIGLPGYILWPIVQNWLIGHVK